MDLRTVEPGKSEPEEDLTQSGMGWKPNRKPMPKRQDAVEKQQHSFFLAPHSSYSLRHKNSRSTAIGSGPKPDSGF